MAAAGRLSVRSGAVVAAFWRHRGWLGRVHYEEGRMSCWIREDSAGEEGGGGLKEEYAEGTSELVVHTPPRQPAGIGCRWPTSPSLRMLRYVLHVRT